MAVYITQEVLKSTPDGKLQAQYDFTPARKYGELKVIVSGQLSLVSTVPVVRIIKEKLVDFNDDDYLLAMGDPGIVGIASIIAAQRNNGRLKMLKWDRQDREYIPIEIDITGRSV